MNARQIPIPKVFILTGLLLLTLTSVSVYLAVRLLLFMLSDYSWYEQFIAFLLLAAEAFILVHCFGYFLNILHVVLRNREIVPSLQPPEPLEIYPPVAIIVSSYKEPLEVVEDTLTCFYNLTYPNKYLYFLDDTRYDAPNLDPEVMGRYRLAIDTLCKELGINLFRRKWHGAKAGMINDFLDFLAGRNREGFEFSNFFPRRGEEEIQYIIVFDADMNPFPDFVEPLVARMEGDRKLAFIQTPQYYTNFEYNRVAHASGLQQAIFYEYICEGKSLQDAMFCCGTNVIFRREALEDVGGFDVTSVTEDFATSLKFHMRGWRSAYLSKVCAFGMGPEDLFGYFRQQFRWALGTVGLYRTILIAFLKNPKMLSWVKWWEYFLSGTHYFVGWVFFILVMCPVLYLTLDVPSYFIKPEFYILIFTPYIVFSMSLFLWTLRSRKYRIQEILFGLILTPVTFPVYMRASLLAMLGVRGTFGITPKGGSTCLPLHALWPQLILAVLCFFSLVWGLLRLYYEREPVSALVVNCFWCLYHGLILSSVLYFNFSQRDAEK
jgi:cellulose synthase (UDP-forming)